MNAKVEFLDDTKGKQVKCATIKLGCDWGSEPQRAIDLKVGYSSEDYATFLKNLNTDYDSGYGSQELFGTVWFDDNSWLERDEYDGSEQWVEKSLPDIPKDLLT